MTAQTNVRFAKTPVLNIGYEEHGDPSGFPIMLLHGFPYDIRSFDGVVPPLVEAGHRVIVPYLRGYGATSFLDPDTPRTAEQAAIGQDVVDLAEALGIDRLALAGFDWGLRAACITSILHPGDGHRLRGHGRVFRAEHHRQRIAGARLQRSQDVVSMVFQH